MSDPAKRLHGPFFAILNPDGMLRCDEVGDPFIYRRMGPHDNHSKHGRKIVEVFVAERLPTPADPGPLELSQALVSSLSREQIKFAIEYLGAFPLEFDRNGDETDALVDEFFYVNSGPAAVDSLPVGVSDNTGPVAGREKPKGEPAPPVKTAANRVLRPQDRLSVSNNRRTTEPPVAPQYDRDKYPTACLAVEAFIEEYVDSYEMVGEDEEGREGHYTPDSDEDALIRDAIAGLHGDEDFVTLIGAEYVERQARRAAEGCCLNCGGPAGQHWGKCSADETDGGRS